MVPQNTFSRAVQYSLVLGTVVMAVITILWTGPAWAEGEKPLPTTTANSEVPVKELELLLRPLTKDDLKVEADGWLALLKEHASRLSRNKIDGLRVEGDAKAKLLAEALVTPLAVTRLGSAEAVAVSRICTHEGCTVALPGAAGATLVCPCHGSRFQTNGLVVNGPAARALRQFPTRIVGNEVVVNTSV